MTVLSKRNAVCVSMSSAIFIILKAVGVNHKISIFSSSLLYTFIANQDDIQFLFPIISSSFLAPKIRNSGYSKWIYSLCMSYIMFAWGYDPQAIGKKFRRFIDQNCGMQTDELHKMRMSFKKDEWLSKEYTDSQNFSQIRVRSLRQLSLNVTKLLIFQIIFQCIISRKLRINLKRRLVDWIRIVLFLFVVNQNALLIPGLHNKYRHFINKNETEIKKYKPSDLTLYVYGMFASYIGVHLRRKEEIPLVAAIVLCQSAVVMLNKYTIDIRAVTPIMCAFFAADC